MKTKEVDLSKLIADNKNANKGTVRGLGMLERSLRQYGTGRSVLVDRNNRIIAGNKTVEVASGLGLTDALVLENDGSKIVVIKRTDIDLDSEEGRGLAIADNRVAEVGLEWDTEALSQLQSDVDLSQFWFEAEMPEIDFDDALNGGGGISSNNEVDFDSFEDLIELKFKFDRDTYELLVGKLWEHGEETLEANLLKVLMK